MSPLVCYCRKYNISNGASRGVVVHMKEIGNKEYKNIKKDTLIRTTGQNRRLEAIRITGKESFYLYRVHQKSIGWGQNGPTTESGLVRPEKDCRWKH